jgi:hypothetical protein
MDLAYRHREARFAMEIAPWVRRVVARYPQVPAPTLALRVGVQPHHVWACRGHERPNGAPQ